MTKQSRTIVSQSPQQTIMLAECIAPALAAGDVILLQGDVGAGKTHFARALIQSILGVAEDVPSPTYTLVQTYPASSCDIWHADLYRLTSVQEVEELGLIAAFETDLCLVEWPDRLGPLLPDHALSLTFEPEQPDDARRMLVEWADPKWNDKVEVWGP